MWATLAAATLGLIPAQASELKLSNVRATYGFLGATRSDTKSPRLAQGDVLFIAYDVDGLKVGADGKAVISMGMELKNKVGKIIYRQEPRKHEVYLSLGGTSLRGVIAHTDIGTDTEPGEYSMSVIFRDEGGTKPVEATISQPFEVVKPDFAIVRLGMSYDDVGNVPAPPVGVTGQRVFVNFLLINPQWDAKKGESRVTVLLKVSEDGKPTLAKPIPVPLLNRDEKTKKVIPVSLDLPLSRAGKFTVEVVATDELAKKETKASFNLTVNELK